MGTIGKRGAVACAALTLLVAGCAVSEPADPSPTPMLPQASEPAAGVIGTASGETPSGAQTPSSSATAGTGTASGPGDAGTASAVSGMIVFDGDSLTDQNAALPGEDYPSFVMRQLPAGLRKANVAVSGQTWPDLLTDVQAEVDPLYSADRRFNILVVWCGTNDLTQTHGGERIWEEMATYCRDRRERGFTVVVLTILATSPPYLSPRYEEERRVLNDLIRDNWKEIADAMVDIARDSRIGDPAGASADRYYSDSVHHNGAGNQVIADAVAATLAQLVGASAPSASSADQPASEQGGTP